MEKQTDGGAQRRGEERSGPANRTPWRGARVRGDIETRIHDARDAVVRADQTLRDTVRERPFMAVGMALAIGYLLSRAMARR